MKWSRISSPEVENNRKVGVWITWLTQLPLTIKENIFKMSCVCSQFNAQFFSPVTHLLTIKHQYCFYGYLQTKIQIKNNREQDTRTHWKVWWQDVKSCWKWHIVGKFYLKISHFLALLSSVHTVSVTLESSWFDSVMTSLGDLWIHNDLQSKFTAEGHKLNIS